MFRDSAGFVCSLNVLCASVAPSVTYRSSGPITGRQSYSVESRAYRPKSLYLRVWNEELLSCDKVSGVCLSETVHKLSSTSANLKAYLQKMLESSTNENKKIRRAIVVQNSTHRRLYILEALVAFFPTMFVSYVFHWDKKWYKLPYRYDIRQQAK